MDPETQATTPEHVTTDAEFAAAFNEASGHDEVPAQAAAERSGQIPGELPEAVANAGQTEAVAAEQQLNGGDQAAAGMDLDAALSADAQAESTAGTEEGDGEDKAAELAAREAELAAREQKLKSWEGRLKALARSRGEPDVPPADAGATDAEPADAGSDEGADAATQEIESIADATEQSGDSALAEAAEQLAEKVEDAEITPDEARRILAEDFGDGFIKLLEVISRETASQHAAKSVEELKTSALSEIDKLKNAYQRSHFKMIAQSHPDFREVAQTPEFKQFVSEAPEREQIVQAGDAWDIVALLNDFKGRSQTINPTASAEPDDDLANAELESDVVQATGGIQLPASPEAATSYEDAWAKF